LPDRRGKLFTAVPPSTRARSRSGRQPLHLPNRRPSGRCPTRKRARRSASRSPSPATRRPTSPLVPRSAGCAGRSDGGACPIAVREREPSARSGASAAPARLHGARRRARR
jgi:hypothetical protein